MSPITPQRKATHRSARSEQFRPIFTDNKPNIPRHHINIHSNLNNNNNNAKVINMIDGQSS